MISIMRVEFARDEIFEGSNYKEKFILKFNGSQNFEF